MASILVIPREYTEPLKLPQFGVKKVNIGHLHQLITDHGMFIDRDQAEKDTRYKQVVPYLMVRKPSEKPALASQIPSEVLRYVRTKKSGEERLVGKSSIGFGGHVEDHDGHSPLLCVNHCIDREMDEELDFPASVKCEHPQFAVLINDDNTDVGQVHMGLLYIIDIVEEKEGARHEITSPDDNISELRWSNPMALDVRDFESWSQIVLQNIFKVPK